MTGGRTVPLEAMPRYSSRRWIMEMRSDSCRICLLSTFLLGEHWASYLHNVVLLVLLVFRALC